MEEKTWKEASRDADSVRSLIDSAFRDPFDDLEEGSVIAEKKLVCSE